MRHTIFQHGNIEFFPIPNPVICNSLHIANFQNNLNKMPKSICCRFTVIVMGICFGVSSFAQPKKYTVANAHSHNDYENPVPFFTAYRARFGSIEADIFLEHGNLFVAHDTTELKRHRTLVQYYLDPLMRAVEGNSGHAYPDSGRFLQMLIDIKTDSVETLYHLMEALKVFPLLINNRTIRWVITGNRPDPDQFYQYPSYILFDGRTGTNYSTQALAKIAMLSADFKNYSRWHGRDSIDAQDKLILLEQIDKAHDLGKPIRFWGAPDTINAWKQLEQLGVDYINTDHIDQLADFLNKP
jgi:alkaline phosphatase